MSQPTPTYRPPNFAGIRTFMRLPHTTDLDGVEIAVVGVPFDTGVTHLVGGRFGPEAIRSYSMLLRIQHTRTLQSLSTKTFSMSIKPKIIALMPAY
ncbi:arginase family protein [Iningainema tapete]|uniref:Arginase family protein n=1 Tax=Iningainema tapete BLCC-T55 TaxID=2748662 RepID=A0A8J7BX02_9CYAN|nr:arginase family protein [Iningainema tapete]MBD2771978.1 arginase family protein [Iningainema tapete BLCC-T55]